MSGIICQNVTKSYKRTPALQGVTAELEDKAIIGLTGPNGAGKSTLLRLLAGYYRPDGGQITIFGQDPFENLTLASQSILIDERMCFPEGLTLGDILDTYANFYSDFDLELAQKLADYFNLNLNKRPLTLSKGMGSAFRGILGLCANTPLTLFDEPTDGMDAGVRKDFCRALLKSYLKTPRLMLISTHLLREMEDIMEYIWLIDRGKTVLCQSTAEMKEAAYLIQGPRIPAEEWAKNRRILFRQAQGDFASIIINEKPPQILPDGLWPKAVSASELCVYLTNRTFLAADKSSESYSIGQKEGIDDVFQ